MAEKRLLIDIQPELKISLNFDYLSPVFIMTCSDMNSHWCIKVRRLYQDTSSRDKVIVHLKIFFQPNKFNRVKYLSVNGNCFYSSFRYRAIRHFYNKYSITMLNNVNMLKCCLIKIFTCTGLIKCFLSLLCIWLVLEVTVMERV